MKQTLFAKRAQIAHEQLQTAVLTLAETLDLEAPEMNPRTRQPKVARLVRDENLGAFLAEVAEAVEGGQTAVLEQAEGYLSESEILTIPGLTKTSQAAITGYFADLAETAVLETDPPAEEDGTPDEEELAPEATETDDAGSD